MSTVEFGTVFQFIRNGMNVKQDKSGDGVPITRIETIWNSGIDADRVGYAGLDVNDCRDWLLEKGDLLFSHINSVEHIGKCAVYGGIPSQLVHGMNLLCLRCDQTKIIPEFAKYLIRSKAFRSKLTNYINKAVNQASVSIGNLKGIPVHVPPLSEQRRIAAILDKADALRAKRREALAQLDSLAQSIFEETFGDVLSTAERTSLGTLVDEFRYGTSNKSGATGYPALRIPNVVGGSLDLAELKTVDVDAAELARLKLIDGDLLFVRTNGNPDYVGRCSVFNQALVAGTGHDVGGFIYASYLIRARLKDDRLSPTVLQFYLSTAEGRRELRSYSKTSAGQFNINTEGLGALRIPNFPMTLQKGFVARLASIEKQKKTIWASARELDALFSSLQHRAFHGEL